VEGAVPHATNDHSGFGHLGSKLRAGFLLLLAGASAFWLARGGEEARVPIAKARPPLVRVQSVETESVELIVRTRGLVEPRTLIDLIPEVSGRVVRVSSALATGGFFDEGDLLLAIDDRDYRSTRKRALAGQIRAESEARLAASHLERLRTLAGNRVASRAALDDAESRAEIARAAVLEAEAAVEDADRSLERTLLRAPFDGRVREKWVDVGQNVGPGKPVARLHAVDYAEVRLPILNSDLAHLNVSLDAHSAGGDHARPKVILRADFAGEVRQWNAEIVRIEGHLDPLTRMVHLVARVEDPYGRRSEGGIPLAMGLLVDAEIEGRVVVGAQRIPRTALRGDHEILVVDGSGRLHVRSINVIRIDGAQVIARAAIDADEFVCISDQRALVDGMAVRMRLEQAAEIVVADHSGETARESL
jgi:RND family efflux transporter MFP subunit